MRELFVRDPDAAFVRELIQCQVKFMLIGGYAVKAYLPAREAKDLDVLVEPTVKNVQRMIAALANLKIAADFSAEVLACRNKRIPINFPTQYDIDLLTPTDDTDFDLIYERSETVKVNSIEVWGVPHSLDRKMASLRWIVAPAF